MTTTTKETATLPTTGFIRLETILHHYPIGRSTWWAGVKNKTLPPAYKLGPKTTAWRAEDVRALIEKMGGVEVAASVQPHATTQRRAKKGGAA